MKTMRSLVIILLVFFIKLAACREKLFVCYFTNWAQYRPTTGKFMPENVDPNLCTHIIYAFAKVVHDNLEPYEWNDEGTEWSLGLYQRIIDLKSINPKLKVLLGVGGWNHGPGPFSVMVHNATMRRNFVKNSVNFLKKNKFDGLDLDWEYPGSREGSKPTDKELFTLLVKELKIAFINDDFLLTAAVAAGKSNIDNAYEIQKLSYLLDFICLMAYDFHGAWENTTDHNSPLYSRKNEYGEAKYLNADWAVNYWLGKGFPKDKFVLGLATYGRPFKLKNPNDHEPGSINDGAGTPGKFTREKGFLSYFEICSKILNDGWVKKWSDEQKVPYAYGDNEWVGFEDVQSLKIKAKYILEKDLAGAMVWSLSLDDFSGNFCNEGKYPLINAIRNELSNPELIKNENFYKIEYPKEELNKKVDLSNNNDQNNIKKIKLSYSTTSKPKPNNKLFVCYFTNWAQYRPSNGKFMPENIDPLLCTHIIYAFAKVVEDKIKPYEWNDESTEWSRGLYQRVVDLKKLNPNLKVLIGIGGWNHGPEPFSIMAHNLTLRRNFVYNSVEFLKKHRFDGLDLDWEYPGSREGSRQTDKELFTILIRELKLSFKAYNFLLTAAVAAGKSNIDNGYEIEKISRDLDFVSLMAYDFHGAWENTIDHNSPLYSRKNEVGESLLFNADWAVNYWLNRGMPREKFVLGLATYGRPFKLKNPNDHEPGSLNDGAGTPGKFTREKGFLSYFEICSKILNDGWVKKWSDEQKVPYAYGDNEWVGFEDVQSLKLKAKYIVDKDLAGAMVWSFSLDDFSGNFCNEGKYPLINAVRTGINEALSVRFSELSKNNLTNVINNNNYNYYNIYNNNNINFDVSNTNKNLYSTQKTSSSQLHTSLGAIFLNNKEKTEAKYSLVNDNNEYAINTKPVTSQVIDQVINKDDVNNYQDSNLYLLNNNNVYDQNNIVLETTTKKSKPKTNVDNSFICVKDGLFADKSNNCRSFYQCFRSNTPIEIKAKFFCPDGTLFNQGIQVCDWEADVEC